MSYKKIVQNHIREAEMLLKFLNLLRPGLASEQLKQLDKRAIELKNIISSGLEILESLKDENNIKEKVAAEPLPF